MIRAISDENTEKLFLLWKKPKARKKIFHSFLDFCKHEKPACVSSFSSFVEIHEPEVILSIFDAFLAEITSLTKRPKFLELASSA